MDVLSEYTGQTITLTLPADKDIQENGWRWLSIYCIQFTTNFGEVDIPENLNLIPYLVSLRTLLTNDIPGNRTSGNKEIVNRLSAQLFLVL